MLLVIYLDKSRLTKAKSEWDAHLVAEVLLATFKDMIYPLLHEAYDSILLVGATSFFQFCSI